IKQFWSSVSLKKANDVVRLQALIDRRKVNITEDMVRQALLLNDAESIDCMPNEEIFVELARMGYEKPSTKLTFNKAFFSAQWKFLIHTILQWWILYCLKGCWYHNDDVADDVDDVADAATEPTLPSPTHAITPPLPQQEVASTPSPSPHQSPIAQPSPPPQQQPSQPSHTTNISMDLLNTLRMHLNSKEIATIDADEDVTLEEVAAEVPKDAKLMTEVVTVVATTVTAAPSAARRRKGILIEEPKPLKKQAQIEHDEAYARELEAELNANRNWNEVIEQGEEELEEEASKQSKRKSESSEEKAAKKHKLDEEVEELKTHL
nr:hypothetical protein [Tanacetum cinerariifolium]